MSWLKGTRRRAASAGGWPRRQRTIDPVAYGLVPAAQVRADRAGPSPDFDTLDPLLAARDWRGMAAFLATLPATSERRFAMISRLGNAAADDDTWLREWLTEDPKSVDALTLRAESLVGIAWQIRTSDWAKNVTPEQWAGFFRVLNAVPEVCARAREIDPSDPAPWIALQNAARGLQWSNDDYRALWAEISARAPHSFTATVRAWNYWRPRWYGSRELMEEFVESAIAAAPAGSNLTITRITMLLDDLKPEDAAERTAFYHGERLNRALDEGIADAAASDPGHAMLPYLRHRLAHGLWLADRDSEAVEQFRIIGGYCDAEPWNWANDPVTDFCETRASAVFHAENARRTPQ
jgi:hypothetical protein